MFNEDRPRITKRGIEVFITLANGKEFEGIVFLNQNERVTDLLNDKRDFLPIALPSGKVSAVRKSAIDEILMTEDSDVEEKLYKSASDFKPTVNMNGDMDKTKACEIIGVDKYYTREEVLEKYRYLIMHMHPDRGGSEFLAIQLNLARDFLLGEQPKSA